MDKDRAKKLDTVFSQIEKQFGEGSLMKLGSDQVRKIPSISTGALSIDLALGKDLRGWTKQLQSFSYCD